MHTIPVRRIALLENHPTLRLGYRQQIEADSRLDVTYEGACEHRMLEDMADDPPDLLVLGLGRSKNASLNFLRHLRETLPNVKTLVISPHRSLSYVRQTNHAGADGYLCWAHAPDKLGEAVNAILAGEAGFPEHLQHSQVRENTRRPVCET